MVQIFPYKDAVFDARQSHCRVNMIAAIERALAECEGLDASKVQVTILGRFVVLDGQVEEQCVADRAVAVASEIAGTGYVCNRLLVRWAGLTRGEGWHRH